MLAMIFLSHLDPTYSRVIQGVKKVGLVDVLALLRGLKQHEVKKLMSFEPNANLCHLLGIVFSQVLAYTQPV